MAADIISCIEHESLPIVDNRHAGQRALGRKHARLLSKIESSLPCNTFRWGHNRIKWTQYCGVIQLGDLTLEILPKIHGKEDDPGSCRDALVRMLKKAKQLRSHRGGQASVNIQKHTLLDVFILHFCEELQAQIVQGKIKRYTNREENLPVLRGRLLTAQQLKHNLFHRERLYCRYDELGEDIPLNRIIKFTLRLLLPKTRSPLARKRVTELLMSFDSVRDVSITGESFDRLVIDRVNARYQAVIDQCKIFVRGLNPDVLAGSGKAFSLLFDMNRLFETWVAAIMRGYARRQGLRLREQGPRKYLAHRLDIDKSVFQMKPDIALLDQDNQVTLLADAKWKLLDATDHKLGVSQGDMYQMQAYANRYGVDHLALIYPAERGLAGSYPLQFKGMRNCWITIVSLDVMAREDSVALQGFLNNGDVIPNG